MFQSNLSKQVRWLSVLVMLALAACQVSTTPQATIALEATATSEATVAPTMTTAPLPEASATATIPAQDVINVASDPTLGPILVGVNGMTLYMYTLDELDKSNCVDACLQNWPPLVTEGNPLLGEGVDPNLIGTATLPDGSLIVTYNHMPLYYFIGDLAPGDVTGQNSNQVWFVVAPDGNPVGIPNTNSNSNVNGNSNSNSNSNSNDDNGNDNGGG